MKTNTRYIPRHDSTSRCNPADWHFNANGNVAIEFALVLPLLVVFLLGIVCYGGYFWMSHSLQQLANDAARSAVAGLSASEREELAQGTVNGEIGTYGALNPSLATVSYQGSSQAFTISIAYNAASAPFWAVSGLIPMPSKTIVRSAAIKLGGY